MGTIMKVGLVAAFLAMLGLASGCEDTPITAGKDYKMSMVASPSTVDFPPGVTTQTTDVAAVVVSDQSVPVAGLSVLFTTSSAKFLVNGQEANAAQAQTDNNGRATVVLRVTNDNPEAQITVTATSGALTQTVKINITTVAVCASNTAPTAVIVPPAAQSLPAGTLGTQVSAATLDGSTSTDLESGIADYAWDCGNNQPVVHTTTVTCTYDYLSTPRLYVIKLVVTDAGLNGHPECALPSSPASVNVTVPAGTTP